MLITIDTDKDNGERIRSLIGFLIHLYNLDSESIEALVNTEVPEGTTAPFIPAAPSAATSAVIATSVASVAATAPATATTVPAPASNVVNFPVPPPPPSAATAQDTPLASAAPSTLAPSVTVAAGAGPSVPAEYDSAGMPWDARIHQKARSKKKDGTWKIQKGIDTAIVQAVTAELASRKVATTASPALPPIPANVPPPPPGVEGEAMLRANLAVGAVPPPPPPVTLPPGPLLPDTVPVPPVPSTAPVETVSAPAAPVAGVVPIPPVTPAGPVGVTYRSIIDKMTAGTKAQTLTAAKVLQIVQDCGCPNLQQLNQMSAIWPDVDARIELALAGL